MRTVFWLKAAMYAVIVIVFLVGAIDALAAPLAQASLPQEFGSNYVLASALIGALLPVAIAFVINRHWTSEQKGIAAAALCVAGAALVAFTQGVLDPADYLRSLLIVFTLAQILYATFYKPSGIAGSLNRGA